MTEYLDSNAELIIKIVVLTLTVFSAIVFFGTIFSRWLSNRLQKQKEVIREELSGLIIQFVCEDLSIEELKARLNTKADYAILLKLSNELEKTLEGTEKERLKRLLNIPAIREFFTGRFKSGEPLEMAKACLYYSKLSSVKGSVLSKILKYTDAEHPMLAYSASLAVISHGDIGQKKITIKNLLANNGLSNQALNDVFAEFQKSSSEDNSAESKILINLISNRSYSNSRTSLLINTLGELGFYESAGFLLEEFMSLPETGYDEEITVALIKVLTGFGMAEILDRVHIDFIVSDYREVREVCAKAMGVFKSPESIPFLQWLVVDHDFYVSFYAIKALYEYDGYEFTRIKIPEIDINRFDEMIGEIEMMNNRGLDESAF